MFERVILHSAGIALAVISFASIRQAVVSSKPVPFGSAGENRTKAEETRWKETDAAKIKQAIETSAQGDPQAEFALKLLEKSDNGPEPSEAGNKSADDTLLRALLTYELAAPLDADSTKRREFIKRADHEIDVDLQSAILIAKLIDRGNHQSALATLLEVLPLKSAAKWIAASLICSKAENLESNVLPLYEAFLTKYPELARETGEILLSSPEGITWLAKTEGSAGLIAKFMMLPEIPSTSGMEDCDVSSIDIQTLLSSNEAQFQKADKVRNWIRSMPLAKLLAEADSLLEACREPLWKTICAQAIIERVAYTDVRQALQLASRMEGGHGVKVSTHDIVRTLLDSDPWEASKVMADMPPGASRDSLIVPLLQKGRLSEEERRAWTSAIQDPKLRSQYEAD